MDSTNASAPLLKVEGVTQLPPTLVETTIVKVEVIDTGKNENSVNGSGVGSGEGSVAVNGGGGESGDVDSEVTDIFGRMLSVVQTSPRAVCIFSAVEERTSRVAPNGRSKRRRVSTNQTVSIVIFTLTWRFLAVPW
ncbi:hypothetical protein RHMOL_Rhmol10G0105500 [Rhododendron molle]|uniref:Uncharacterized protein n=1 Tax=Rhododendron molle TaxID=49168 RepID=A0ACC0M214_RHOML|nr:hypothetical protein RHMOL_Rhmol10G0105500 [Rhododendron molle]